MKNSGNLSKRVENQGLFGKGFRLSQTKNTGIHILPNSISSQTIILDLMKLAKVLQNGRELEKGEIARFEHFLLFSRCFQKTSFQMICGADA